jgi:uncharacterized protein YxjI
MGRGDRRARRREERETFGRGGSARRYRTRQKMLLIGDVYWIEDEKGEWVFRVYAKALRLQKTFHFEDAHGRPLCIIQKQTPHLDGAMEIEGPQGRRMALVHKASSSPLREQWKVDVENGPDLTMRGSVGDHEYTIDADGRKVARVSTRSLRLHGTYGVDMAPDQNSALLLAVTVAVDELAH